MLLLLADVSTSEHSVNLSELSLQEYAMENNDAILPDIIPKRESATATEGLQAQLKHIKVGGFRLAEIAELYVNQNQDFTHIHIKIQRSTLQAPARDRRGTKRVLAGRGRDVDKREFGNEAITRDLRKRVRI